MAKTLNTKIVTFLALTLVLASCGRVGGVFERKSTVGVPENVLEQRQNIPGNRSVDRERETIWDLFRNNDDPNVTVEVNKYIWNAALDILDFMPIESADPFTGIIVYGYGTPPGSNRAYRATVYVQDPALDARSLRLALVARSGPVSTDTVQQIEDAILTRARQLRIADGRL